LAGTVRNRLAHGAASVPGQEMRTRLERRSAFDDVRGVLGEIRYLHATQNEATQGVMLRRLVWGLADIGLLEEAAVVAGAEARASLNLPMRVRERRRHETVMATLAERLGAPAFETLRTRGASLSDEELLVTLTSIATAVEERADD
jgi:hypothetical protein